MNSIPLISNVPGVNFSMNRGNTSPEVQMRQEINTSLVALKKEAGTLEGLINEASQILDEVNNRIATLENDTVKKSDIVDVVQSGNMNPVTSNAVVPVDEVTSGNMQSVSSNAVANKFRDYAPKFLTAYASGTLTANGYLSTSIPLSSKFIVSATCLDEQGYAVVPTRVNGNWWFFVFGVVNGYVSPRSGNVDVEYYYYDL